MRPFAPTTLALVPDHAAPPASPPSPRYPVLDGLRGFAALGIAVVHYLIGPSHKIPALDRSIRFLEMTPFSVDVFFVLSGFLIGGILLRARTASTYYSNFYRRRFYRILPLYYLWVALFCFFYLVAQGWGLNPPSFHGGPVYLASFIFLFQNFFPSFIRSTYIMQPTWTLVVEEHFYLLVPFGVRRLSTRRLVQVLFTVIFLGPVLRAVLFRYIGNRSDWADIATRIFPPCRADALAMGVLLAIVWHYPELREWFQRRLTLFIWAMFAASGFAILLDWMATSNFHSCRSLNVALGRTAIEFSCFCLIVYLICRPQTAIGRFFSSDVMRGLGKISYCLYLVHWGVLWMIFRFIVHTRFGQHLWLDFSVAPLALLISIGISMLSWKYIEGPLMQRAHRPPQPRPSRAIVERPSRAIQTPALGMD